MDAIADIRKDYRLKTLSEKDTADEPIKQFSGWWEEAISSHIDEVNAMTLATCDNAGNPSARIVLLKGLKENGFVFFTNYESRKAHDLTENNKAALVFFWKELERQVRIEGIVLKTTAKESDEYFYSRPEDSRLGAWSSPQSSIITSREILAENVKLTEKKFEGKNIERPPFWGGYILEPRVVEFWQGRSNRLHDRIQYIQEDGMWKKQRLAP
jgi:pyridoxamine 5'-phosphate oxidase